MPFQQLSSSGRLADHIHCFWYTERLFTPEEPFFDILPDGFVELIFFYDATCAHERAGGNLTPLSSPFLVGLLDKPVRLRIIGPIRVLAVRGYPWMLFPLLNLRPHTNEHLQIGDDRFLGISLSLQQVLGSGSPLQALQELKRCCEQAFLPLPDEDRLLHKAGLEILEENGANRIGDLAAGNNMTLKTVERKFKNASGNSAKKIARKVRFERVRNYLWFHPDSILSAVACEFGFTDPSHFNREFKAFSGQTPSAFATAAAAVQKIISKNVEIIQL